jgi:hypothetical protein
MGSCCGNEAPTPPDPQATARAQTGTNVSTAVANAYLGNINQQTPDGSLTYSQSGTYDWTDPSNNQTYHVPTFTATQQLSPSGLQLKNTQDSTKQTLADLANSQAGRASGLLSTNLNTSGGPSGGDSASITNIPKALTNFDPGIPLQTGFDSGGDITRDYGPADNYSADRQRVEDSLMQRMNPQLQVEQQRIQQQLADQGIRYGSQAYNDAMRVNSMQANDARYGAIQQAGQEQQRMDAMAAQRAAFQNAAQEQGYQQNLGQASFYNQAGNTLFQQNAAQAAFANAGLAQQVGQAQSGFNAAQAGRNSWLQEQYANRNQPINEISALMSGSQVSQPNFVNAPSSQIPTTDYAGITQQGFQNQMGIYNQNSQNINQLVGGALGLGAGIIKSDRRAKDDIDKIGTVFAANADGARRKLPVYEYSYKDDPSSTRHIGPMAQDVEKIAPEAVEEHRGVKYIKPRQVMGSILGAA